MSRCWVMAIWSFFSHWPDIGDQRPEPGDRTRRVILYSVPCCYAVHWTDNEPVLLSVQCFHYSWYNGRTNDAVNQFYYLGHRLSYRCTVKPWTTGIRFMEGGRPICPIAAVCTVLRILSLKYIQVASLILRVTWRHRSRDRTIRYIWFHIGALLTLKSGALTIVKLLALNAPKFKGSRDPDHPRISQTYASLVSGISLGTRLSNLKFVS